MSTLSFTNQYHIAKPSLADPNFQRTVTYVCEHNDRGAMGIVINRPLNLTLGEVFDHMHITAPDRGITRHTVFMGGPVQTERGIVLHQPAGRWDNTLHITQDMGMATSKENLEDIARGHGPAEIFVALGYAGGGAGQLVVELSINAWLSGPAVFRVIFLSPCHQRWESAGDVFV